MSVPTRMIDVVKLTISSILTNTLYKAAGPIVSLWKTMAARGYALGSASQIDTGVSTGNAPLIGANGRIPSEIVPGVRELSLLKKNVMMSGFFEHLLGLGADEVLGGKYETYATAGNIDAGNSSGYVFNKDNMTIGREFQFIATNGIGKAHDWEGATSDFVWNGPGTLSGVEDTAATSRAIRTLQTIVGDFDLTWEYGVETNNACLTIVYSAESDALFSATASGGNLLSGPVASWAFRQIDTPEGQVVDDGVSEVAASNAPLTDTYVLSRRSGIGYLYKNDVLIHTYGTEYHGPMRLALSTDGDGNTGEWETILIESAFGKADLTGATVTADSEADSQLASYATDGDDATYWKNNAANDGSSDWHQSDLASSLRVYGYEVVMSDEANDVPTGWTLLGWDGVKWVFLDAYADSSISASSKIIRTLPFPTTVSKIRFNFYGSSGGTYIRIAEISLIKRGDANDAEVQFEPYTFYNGTPREACMLLLVSPDTEYEHIDPALGVLSSDGDDTEEAFLPSAYADGSASARTEAGKELSLVKYFSAGQRVSAVEVIAPKDGFSSSADGTVTLQVFGSHLNDEDSRVLLGESSVDDGPNAKVSIAINSASSRLYITTKISHDGTANDCAVGFVNMLVKSPPPSDYYDDLVTMSLSRDDGVTFESEAVDLIGMTNTELSLVWCDVEFTGDPGSELVGKYELTGDNSPYVHGHILYAY